MAPLIGPGAPFSCVHEKLEGMSALESRSSLEVGNTPLNGEVSNGKDCRPEVCNTPANTLQSTLSSEKRQKKSEKARGMPETDLIVQKMSFWRQYKMISETIHNFSRDVTQLRESSRTEIRIYVCSTPDLVEEREMIWSVTLPEIQKVCHRYGLTCHFVDLRLGADRLAGDPEAFKVLQHEIQKCRRLSLGVAFLGLLGSELDDYPVPLAISADIYDMIRGIVLKFNLPDLELLDECYRLDSNNIPPIYNLQVGQYLEETPKFLAENDLIHKLSAVLEEICKIGVNAGIMNNTVLPTLNVSVTQTELEEGLLRLPTLERHGLCVLIDKSFKSSDTSKEIENKASHSIQQVKNSIRNFFYENCPKNLRQVRHSGTKGKPYLHDLHEIIAIRLKEMIEESVAETNFDIRYYIGPISEQIHHVRMSSLLYHNFSGRNELVEKFRKTLRGTFDMRSPIAVQGHTGAGKSTLMAKLTREFQTWTNHSCKIIVRYIGTSPESCFLYALLLNLCHQMSSMFSLSPLTTEDQFSTRRLKEAWWERLEAVSDKVSVREPLVIILDAVDEVCNTENPNEKTLSWIPQKLPIGIILVYSETAQVKSLSHQNIFTLNSLSENEIKEISTKELRRTQRRITEDQQLELVNRLVEEPTVVLLKTILARQRSWPSSFLPDTPNLLHPYGEYLEFVESKIGLAVVKYGLSFLALSRYGMTEKEMTDNLFENKSFISECIVEENENRKEFLKGLPLYLKIGKLLLYVQEFITECKIDGQTVLLFQNPEFKRMILSRYDDNDLTIRLHRQLALYYLTQSRDFALTGRTSSTSQVQKLHKLNLRMVRSAPYHFCRSHLLLPLVDDLVKSKLFCNMNWFLDRALSGTIQELLMEFDDAMTTFEDNELEYFSDVLFSSKEAIIHDPFHIFVIIADSLAKAPEAFTSLRSLSQQALECLRRTDVLQLLPRQKGYLHLGGVLKRSFEIQGDLIHVCYDQKHLLIRKDTTLEVFNLHTGDTVTSFSYCENFAVTEGNDKRLYFYRGSEIVVWNMVTNVREQTLSVNFKCHANIKYISPNKIILQMDNQISCFNLQTENCEASTCFQGKPIAFKSSADGERCFLLFNDRHPSLNVVQIPTFKTLEVKRYSYIGTIVQTEPIQVTDDGKYVVICFQNKVLVLEATTADTLYEIGKENVYFVHSALTRCNEHAILSDSLGQISIWALRTGEEVCAFQLNIPNADLHSESPGIEISALVVSEDDHFLYVGLKSGQCVVLHVPSQCQVLVIQAHPNPLQSINFLTDKKHFQQLLTWSSAGVVKLWNMQDILKESRQAILPFIQDEDLLVEEKLKLGRQKYYKVYTQKRANKTFLNGADVCGFFEIVPDEIFIPIRQNLYTPDSSLKWISTKSLMDCMQVTFCQLGERRSLLATSVNGIGIAIWSMTTCTLQTFFKMKETHLISDLTFLRDDDFMLVKLKTMGTDSFNVIVLSTDTGEIIRKMENILNGTFRNSNDVTVVEQTNRDTHVKLSCFELCQDTRKLWSSILKLAPSVVRESTFWRLDDINVFVRLRDRSTEIWLITVDILEKPSADINNQDHMTSIASSRIFRFPFLCLHADLREHHVILVTKDFEVIIFSVTSGLVTKEFKMDISPVAQCNQSAISLPSVHSTFKSCQMSTLGNLTFEISPTGSFIMASFGDLVEVWSLTNYRKKSQFQVTPGKITSLGISEDDSCVVTGSSLGSVHVWRADTGVMKCSFPTLCYVEDVLISRDGTQVVALVKDTDESRCMVLDVKTPRQLLAES